MWFNLFLVPYLKNINEPDIKGTDKNNYAAINFLEHAKQLYFQQALQIRLQKMSLLDCDLGT